MDEGGGVSGKLGRLGLIPLANSASRPRAQFDGYYGLSLGVGRTYIPPEVALAGLAVNRPPPLTSIAGMTPDAENLRDAVLLARQQGSLEFAPDGKTTLSAEHFGINLWYEDRLLGNSPEPVLTYQPLSFTADARLFNDLVSYAPGLNTSRADMLAVLDDEAAPDLRDTPGTIDTEARKLIDRCGRTAGRRSRYPLGEGKPGIMLTFDGSGRYTYERRVSFGLHGARCLRRQDAGAPLPRDWPGRAAHVTRFHRAELANLVPWWLPPATDMARGCDLVLVGPRTVGAGAARGEELRYEASLPRERGSGPPPPCSRGRLANYLQYQLVFADDGRLAERQLVLMPEKKVLVREIYDGKGGVRILDADGKEVVSHKRELKEGGGARPGAGDKGPGRAAPAVPIAGAHVPRRGTRAVAAPDERR